MRNYYIGSAIILVISLILIIVGFSIVGSPITARDTKLDEQRLTDFSTIQSAIDSFVSDQNRLPTSLKELQVTYSDLPMTDPGTKKGYIYIPSLDFTDKLCTTFSTDSKQGNQLQQLSSGVVAYNNNGQPDMSHKRGYDCLQFVPTNYNQTQTNTDTITPTPTPATLPDWKDSIASIHNYGVGLQSPNAMVEDGNTLWVIERNDPVLVQLGVNGAGEVIIVKKYPLPSHPNGIAIVNKQLWIATGRQIDVYSQTDPSTILKTITDTHTLGPTTMLQVGNTVWVVDIGYNVIELFTTDGVYTGKQVPIGSSSFISALAYINHAVWALDTNNNQVRIIDTNTLTVTKKFGETSLVSPSSIIQIGSKVLIANSTVNTITIFDTSGNLVSQDINDPSIGSPVSLTADVDGKTFYILNSETDSVTKMSFK